MDSLEEYIETGNGPAIEDLLNSNPRLAAGLTSQGMSPLLLACYYNKPQAVKTILKHLDQLDVFEAAAVGHLERVTELVQNDSRQVNAFSDHGFSTLGIATHFGHEDVIRYLLANHADPNLPSRNGYHVFPLHTAIGAGFATISKMLVEAGAEVNVFQASRISPLHLAAQNGDIDLIILLLENGAVVEVRSESGQSPSDLARERGHTEIAQILAV